MRHSSFAFVFALAVAASTPAAARNCYENFSNGGCPWQSVLAAKELNSLSCENLAHIRNQLYNENGYCFAKPEYAEFYDNSDCVHGDQAAVPLSDIERDNIDRIRTIEKDKGC